MPKIIIFTCHDRNCISKHEKDIKAGLMICKGIPKKEY